MPLIDLTFTEDALTPDAQADLAANLTSALVRHEGAPDSELARAMAWVFLHPSPRDATYVGGQPAELPVYRAVITIPEGTLLHGPAPFGVASRQKLVREVTDLILAAEGGTPTPADRGRVYCLIHEVPDGYWGALGSTVRMEDIASIASGEDETRLGREAREAIDTLMAARRAAA